MMIHIKRPGARDYIAAAGKQAGLICRSKNIVMGFV